MWKTVSFAHISRWPQNNDEVCTWFVMSKFKTCSGLCGCFYCLIEMFSTYWCWINSLRNLNSDQPIIYRATLVNSKQFIPIQYSLWKNLQEKLFRFALFHHQKLSSLCYNAFQVRGILLHPFQEIVQQVHTVTSSVKIASNILYSIREFT